MSQASGTEPPSADGVIPAKQRRSRKTRDRLLEAGHRLIEAGDLDALTIAGIAKAAGCSVGTFYGRFADKDAFFQALIANVIAQGRSTIRSLLETADDPVEALVAATVQLFRRRGGLLRAALRRNMRDPAVWGPLRQHGHVTADLLVERLCRDRGRRLSEGEEIRVRFAFQVLYGTLNNILLNAPGPLRLEDPVLPAELVRVFRLVMAAGDGRGTDG